MSQARYKATINLRTRELAISKLVNRVQDFGRTAALADAHKPSAAVTATVTYLREEEEETRAGLVDMFREYIEAYEERSKIDD